MEMHEREAFSKTLLTVGQMYGKVFSPLLVKLYWQILAPFTLTDVVEAFKHHLQDTEVGQYMPKPADVIRLIKGNNQCQALQGWTKVEQAIRQIGPYRSVVFDDCVIHAVLHEIGGWIKICQTENKQMPFVAKEFQIRFRGYQHKQVQQYPKYFIGIQEHQNKLQGFEFEDLVLIGDQIKARAVLNKGQEQLLQVGNVASQAIATLALSTLQSG